MSPQPANEAAVVAGITAPQGQKEIVSTFGDIYGYIRPGGSLDPRWQEALIGCRRDSLPFRLSWDHSKSVSRITSHKLMVEIFTSVFSLAQPHGLQSRITIFGGCF